MPEGGLDSRNLREALRRRPELFVDDRLCLCDMLSLWTLLVGVRGGCEDVIPPSLEVAMFDVVRKGLPMVARGRQRESSDGGG